jgi:hypothetical protein
MIFLIDHERQTGRTLCFKTYTDLERRSAQQDRLRIELDLNRQGLLMQREVLLLEARDEKAIRRTHPRYFMNLPESSESPVIAH